MPFRCPFENCKADTPPTLYVGPGETYTHIQDALNKRQQMGIESSCIMGPTMRI